MDPERVLQGIPFFAGLAPSEIGALTARLRMRRYQRNEVICRRDDPGECLYLVLTGVVKIGLASADGREVILTLLSDGDYFGELALLDGEPRSADAIALEPSELGLLPREAFTTLVESNAEVALRLLSALSRNYIRRLTDAVHDSVFLDVPARLARVLIARIEEAPNQGDNGGPVRLTQGELAAMVGATRESVNKWLGYYERQGWLRRERGAIVVVAPDALVSQAR